MDQALDPLNEANQSLLVHQNQRDSVLANEEWQRREQQWQENLEQNRRRSEIQSQQLEELLALISAELEIADGELEQIIERRQRERGMTNAQI